MIIIGTMKKQYRTSMMQGFGGLLLLGISVSAWGVCVQSAEDQDAASPIVNAAGTQACENITDKNGNPMIGCHIDKGDGDCDAFAEDGTLLFRAVSSNSSAAGLNWSIEIPTDSKGVPLAEVLISVDAVTINGARGGNSCAYIYGDEADEGFSMGDYSASKDDFANVQTAYFCTDEKNLTLGEPSALPNCGDVTTLDGTGISCGDVDENDKRFLISLDPESPNWNPTACTCNVTFKECNEEAIVVDDVVVGQNKCTADNRLKALPVHFEAGNDGTWICRTIGGVRKCWSR